MANNFSCVLTRSLLIQINQVTAQLPIDHGIADQHARPTTTALES